MFSKGQGGEKGAALALPSHLGTDQIMSIFGESRVVITIAIEVSAVWQIL